MLKRGIATLVVAAFMGGVAHQAISKENKQTGRSHQVQVNISNRTDVPKKALKEVTLIMQSIAGPYVMDQKTVLGSKDKAGNFYIAMSDEESRDIVLKVDAYGADNVHSGYSIVTLKNGDLNVPTDINLTTGPQAVLPGPMYMSQVNPKAALQQLRNLGK